jgi:hypothetical protein
MTIKSALRQPPATSAEFDTGLFVPSVKMVCIVDAGQVRFILHQVEIISGAGIVTTCLMRAEMNAV